MKTPIQYLVPVALCLLLLVGVTISCSKKEDAVPKSSEKAMTSFGFNALGPALNVTIDAAAKTVMTTVPFGTDVTKLVPTISLSAKATVSPASGVAQDFSKTVTYTVTAEDGSTAIYSVAVGVGVPPKSMEKDIVTFAFNGLNPAVNATVDATAKTISATVPTGTDATRLVSTITVSDKAMVSPATGVAQDFSKIVSYTVTAEDGTTQVWNVGITAATPVTNGTLNDLIFVANAAKSVFAFDAQSGTKKWEFTAGDIFRGMPVYVDGVIYIGNNDKKMYAIDAKNGAKKWEFLTGAQIDRSSAMVIDGVVFFGSDDKKLYALDAATGTKKWEFLTGDIVETSPTVVNGLVYFGSSDKKLYALDAITGTKKWEFLTEDVITSSPSVVDGVVYFGGADKKMYALNAVTGVKKWEYLTNYSIQSAPTVDNGVVYFSSKNLIALDAATGMKIWEFVVSQYINNTPQVADGIVYCGGSDNRVYALDAKTGFKKWEFATINYVYGAPVIANGIVYVGEREYTLYALDALSGKRRWKVGTVSTVWAGTSVLDKNGKVYYGGDCGMQQ